MKNEYFFLLFLLTVKISFSQLSSIHYIPPITDSNTSPVGQQNLFISTPSSSDISYSITAPGSGLVSSGLDLSQTNPINFTIGNSRNSQLHELYDNSSTIISDKGYIIETSEPSYVSVRIRSGNGSQAGALVSKGESGLGRVFRAGMFVNESVQNKSLNFISVMASLDNTQVTFSNIKQNVVLSKPGADTTVGINYSENVTLNRGESYIISSKISNNSGIGDALIGALIESNKDIIVNVGSLVGTNHSSDGGRDYGMDQIVPTSRIGNQYIFVRGNGNDELENILVVAHEDDTEIILDGNGIVIANIDAGQFHLIKGAAYGVNIKYYLKKK